MPNGGISPFVPPALSLLFSASTLPVLLLAPHVQWAKHGANNAVAASAVGEVRTPSFSGTRLSPSVQSTSAQLSPTSSSGSVPNFGEKISPKSALSDLTAVNHFRLPLPTARNSHVEPTTLESGAHHRSTQSLDRRLSSSASLLVALAASQSAAFLAFLLQIVAVKVGLSSTPSNSVPPTAPNGDSFFIIRAFQSAFMVLCIIGTMSALLSTSTFNYSRRWQYPFLCMLPF